MPKKKESPSRESTPEQTTIAIKWHIPDTITTRIATNMVCQTIEGFFKLSFFELKHEIHLDTPHIPPSEIVAECVGSIVVPPHKLPAIIEVLNTQWLQYQEIQQSQQKFDAVE